MKISALLYIAVDEVLESETMSCSILSVTSSAARELFYNTWQFEGDLYANEHGHV